MISAGRILIWRHCFIAALVMLSSAAHGHEPSIAELRIGNDAARLEAELDAVDLDYVLGLREGGAVSITVGDVRRSAAAIRRYVVERVAVEGCTLAPERGMPGVRDGLKPRVVVALTMQCAGNRDERAITSTLFDELPRYRTVVTMSTRDGLTTLPLQGGTAVVPTVSINRSAAFRLYVTEGWRHIFEGFDHLLFLFLLVLPIARSASFARSALTVAGIVSAFTVAHSITLALSAYGYLSLPAYIVEPVIAGSIVFAAVLNLVSKADRMMWTVAYLFGLIHGFGFAGAFAELAAGAPLRWTDLLGFNLGVELGQLAVTMVVLAVLTLISKVRYAGRLLVPAGSVIVGLVGAAWFIERVT